MSNQPQTKTNVPAQAKPAPAPNGAPATEPKPETNGEHITFNEAPYSWNTSVIDASGFIQQITIRAQTTEGFHKRIAMELMLLQSRGYKPAPQRTFGGKPQRKESVALPTAPHCPQHDEPMHPRQWQAPDGSTVFFWSCPHRDGREFCKARVDERPTANDLEKWKELNQ